MKRFLAPVLVAAVLVASAVPAFADPDVNTLLQQLSQQEQTDTQGRATGNGAHDGAVVLTPTIDDVEMDLGLELGDTREERLAGLVTKLEAQISQQPDNLEVVTELGITYGLQGKQAMAKSMYEKALLIEPKAKTVYDLLANGSTGILVYVNGDHVTFDVQPRLINNRTLVPIRYVTEKLGVEPSWDPATATVTILYGQNEIKVTRDAQTATINGEPVALDSPATIIDGRTLVPLRFVAESMGLHVDPHWSDNHQSLIVSIVPN